MENKLKFETSPYLLQHKDNPVHWYAWGDEAFELSRSQNKPIFLSIGYSTCHWCHVMEHDSFEKEEVAQVLNEYFICIKLDREERPDLDQIYMDAVIAFTGRGGWPMSVFLTPELKPFFGGTFFWKEQFIALLRRIDNLWKSDKEKIDQSADEVMNHLYRNSLAQNQFDLDEEIFLETVKSFQSNFDPQYGGFGSAPKFPRSMDLCLLMRIYQKEKDQDILKMVTTTLDGMAHGGIYDHIGGGFARYSTDSQWLVPHFEKMLYDNALLIYTYSEAYQLTKKSMYFEVIQETINYIKTEMTSPAGGFYSAIDADSEGEEGTFYVWKYEELEELLSSDEFAFVRENFNISPSGNFEDQNNILYLKRENDWSVKKDPVYQRLKQKIYDCRESRIHPFKDDKVLTSWNGLMIAAIAKSYQITGDQNALKLAQDAARFIKNHLIKDERLYRSYRNEETKHLATLEDYSYYIWGLIELYQVDFDESWLILAIELQRQQDQFFWDKENGGYFFSNDNDSHLIFRKKEINDGATPSANGVSLLNLLKLYSYSFKQEFLEQSQELLKYSSSFIKGYPPGYAMTLIGLDFTLESSQEVVVVDVDNTADQFLKKLQADFYPYLIYSKLEESEEYQLGLHQNRSFLDNQTTFYVCSNQSCQKPTNNQEKALKLILDGVKNEG